MKLYLSSYRIPTPDDLAELIGKSLSDVSVALIPNAKDYYIPRARDYKVGQVVEFMEDLGMNIEIVDLQDFDNPAKLKNSFKNKDLIWAMGGNTFMLRYQMQRSSFDDVIKDLLDNGIVYGGDSAGALVAGQSIAGVESADVPEFAEKVVEKGLGLIDAVVLPHVDNPQFEGIKPEFRELHKGKNIIELKDLQAIVIDGTKQKIVEATE